MAYIIGLCGGIGSGKTAVSDYLKEKGYSIIDADLVAREVVEKGSEGLAALVRHFGEAILDDKGALNRKLLGELIFHDEKKRCLVNALLHPLIEERILFYLKALDNEAVIFLVVPLFFEAGYDRYTDEVFYVSAEENIRLERIQVRDNISRDLARKKLQSQMTEAEVVARFNPTVIKNNGSIENLREKVDELLTKRSLEV